MGLSDYTNPNFSLWYVISAMLRDLYAVVNSLIGHGHSHGGSHGHGHGGSHGHGHSIGMYVFVTTILVNPSMNILLATSFHHIYFHQSWFNYQLIL